MATGLPVPRSRRGFIPGTPPLRQGAPSARRPVQMAKDRLQGRGVGLLLESSGRGVCQDGHVADRAAEQGGDAKGVQAAWALKDLEALDDARKLHAHKASMAERPSDSSSPKLDRTAVGVANLLAVRRRSQFLKCPGKRGTAEEEQGVRWTRTVSAIRRA